MKLSQTKSYIIFFLLFGLYESIYSQVDSLSKGDSCLNNILKTKVLRKGIYRSLKEFQTNSPFYACNLTTYKHDNSADYFIKMDGSMLVLVDKNGDKSRIGEPIWGFCDGEKIYYKDPYSVYSEITLKGRFCIYSKYSSGSGGSVYVSSAYNGGSGIFMSTGNGSSSFNDYIIDILTGDRIELTVRNLKKYILVDDPELLAGFNKEENPKFMMDQYIIRYNDRHPVSF
jgi:hypothetical protein